MCEVDLAVIHCYVCSSVDEEFPCAILPVLESCMLISEVHQGIKLGSYGISTMSDSKIQKRMYLKKPHYSDNYENILFTYISYKALLGGLMADINLNSYNFNCFFLLFWNNHYFHLSFLKAFKCILPFSCF